MSHRSLSFQFLYLFLNVILPALPNEPYPMCKCCKHALLFKASRGKLHWLQEKSDCLEVYEKCTLRLTQIITSRNIFLMSLWSKSLR